MHWQAKCYALALTFLNSEASMFYPSAMSKARVRVASVRVKNSATAVEALDVVFLVNRYAAEMNTLDGIARDDGALAFIHDITPNDFAPIITDRVH